ncbi:MAG: rhomboid family intramembrane serine protease [archaeon]
MDQTKIRRYTRRNLRRSGFLVLASMVSVTMWLILVNVLFFFIVMIFYVFNENFIDYIALNPSLILEGKYLWTFVTSMFMHGGFFHLLVNMFVLSSLGSFCEKIIGRKRFFWFYIISGLIAGLMFVVLAGFFGGTPLSAKIFGSATIPAVGASGAIFAIAGLFVILTPKLKFTIIFFPFFSLPAYIMIPVVLFVTWIVSSSAGLPVGNTAHFGGFLAGVVYGLYLRNKYPKKVKRLSQYVR